MQRIITDVQFVYPLFEHLIDLYSDLSMADSIVVTVPMVFSPLCAVLSQGSGTVHFHSTASSSNFRMAVFSDNNVVVCFSGGKDSTALAMKLKEEGKNVHLYFLKGINKSYSDEYKRAEKVASILGLPLYIDEIKLSGKSAFKENPMKNQVVATFALNYALQNDLGSTIAFGDFTEDTIDKAAWDRNWSDTVEMWDAYREVIQSIISGFQLLTPFKNYTETLAIVAQDKNILENVQGCIAPMRFRQHWRNKNLEGYNFGTPLDLLPNRCGSCWKCCVEYIWLTDHGFLDYNLAFYAHCLRLLADKVPTEHPYHPGVKTTEELYQLYIPGSVPNRIKYMTYGKAPGYVDCD